MCSYRQWLDERVAAQHQQSVVHRQFACARAREVSIDCSKAGYTGACTHT
jgi:hypothetical protein